MTAALCAGLAAAVWIARIGAAARAYAWSATPGNRASPTPAPVPLTTGDVMAARWLAVGIAAGLCALLLGYAALLAIRTLPGRRPSLSGAPMRRMRGNRWKG